MTPQEAKDKLFDEIIQYADGREAQELKKRYCPEPTPAADEESAAPAADEDQLDAESLQRLSAMAGE